MMIGLQSIIAQSVYLVILGGQLLEKVRKRCDVIRACIQRAAHQRRAVLVTARYRLIPVGTAVELASQPALFVKVVEHRHHRRVRDLSIALQLVDEFAHRRRLGAVPQPPHDLGLELAKGAGQFRSSAALLLMT